MAKPKKKPKPKVGRPASTLTPQQWATVERMAKAMCTHQEIADYLSVPKATLTQGVQIKERFLEITRKAAAATRLEVRENQLEQARKGQPVGSIWWGKQHLNQTDRNLPTPLEGGPLDQIQGAAQRLADVLDKLAKKADREQGDAAGA